MNIYKHWVIICFLALVSCGFAFAEKPKMATVDMQRLLSEYHHTLVKQEGINADYARVQKIIDVKGKQVAKMRKSIEQIASEMKSDALSEEEKVAKQQAGQLVVQELKIAQRSIDRFTKVERAKVDKKRAKVMESLSEEVKESVRELSEKIGYDYVFDRSGVNTNQVSFFLYLKDVPDITDIVLKELNESSNNLDGE